MFLRCSWRCAAVAFVFALVASAPALAESATDPPEGVLANGRYHHPGMGWRFVLPEDWLVLSRSDVARITGKGKSLIEKSVGTTLEERQVDLLYLKRGPITTFTSTRQRFDPEYGTYAEQQEALFDVILKAYAEAGIPVRSEHGNENIDGVPFRLMHVWLLSKDRRSEVAQQYAYDGRLGDEGLTVSVTSADAADLQAGLAAWRASRFDRAAGSDTKPGTAEKH